MRKVVLNWLLFPKWLRELIWKSWHRYIISKDKNFELKVLNFGYADLDPQREPIELLEIDEPERFGLQLYHHTVSAVNLEGKDVLEVGSGRGGGASYITRYMNPKSYTGLDLSKKLVRFCNKHYQVPGLSFVCGNAEEVPFEKESFDAVVNIESSRDYTNMDAFLSEVHRVLRPDGHLLFADMRDVEANEVLKSQFKKAGLKIVKEANIVQNVLKALNLDNERKQKIIKRGVPRLFAKSAREFAGTKGSKRYEGFVNGSTIYMSYVLRRSKKGEENQSFEFRD